MNGKKRQNEQLKMRSEDVYEDFEDIDDIDELDSRRDAFDIARGGSNRGRGGARRLKEKGSMDNFFTHNVKAVV